MKMSKNVHNETGNRGIYFGGDWIKIWIQEHFRKYLSLRDRIAFLIVYNFVYK